MRALLGAFAAAACLGLAACGGDDEEADVGAGAGEEQAQQTEGPNTDLNIKIGDLVPLTGDLSAFGPPGRKASDLAVAKIEEAVQQAGLQTQVSVEHADTETNPQASVQAARQLVSNGASCLTGAWASADTIPVGESVARRQRVPLISPASTSAAITDLEDGGFVFRTAPSDVLQAKALADVVAEELGGAEGKTLSLAARNDAYGEGFITRFRDAWIELGGDVKGPVLFDPEQPSFNSEAGKIVSGSPDGYVIIDFPDTFAKLGPALVRTGQFDASKLFTADGLAADSVPEGIPASALRGAKGTRPGTPEQGGVVEQFNDLFTSAPGPGRQTFDAQNFDATMLCFLGALKAGSTEGQNIAEALRDVSAAPGKKFDFTNLTEGIKAIAAGEEVDYEGVTGPVDFDENGDPTAATYEVWQYGEDDGKLTVLRQFQAEQQELQG